MQQISRPVSRNLTPKVSFGQGLLDRHFPEKLAFRQAQNFQENILLFWTNLMPKVSFGEGHLDRHFSEKLVCIQAKKIHEIFYFFGPT